MALWKLKDIFNGEEEYLETKDIEKVEKVEVKDKIWYEVYVYGYILNISVEEYERLKMWLK